VTDLAPGKRLRSNAGATEIIVVRSPVSQVELSCGGQPMIANLATAAAATTSTDNDTVLGKRYIDTDTGLEVLCTKPDRVCSPQTEGSSPSRRPPRYPRRTEEPRGECSDIAGHGGDGYARPRRRRAPACGRTGSSGTDLLCDSRPGALRGRPADGRRRRGTRLCGRERRRFRGGPVRRCVGRRPAGFTELPLQP
jgi:hypothetical protein